MAAYPQVMDTFKIIIDFIWNVISLPIYIGNGFQISIFHVMVFIFLLLAVLSFIKLEIPRFHFGWDSYGKFSSSRSNQIRKGK